MMVFRGSTALVTGASSGIGEAIARRLAQEGVDLVLVARSQARLRKLADELAQAHGVRATVLAADLGLPGCGARLRERVDAAGLVVDVLVNNAGFGLYGPFETLAPAVDQAQIALNVRAVVDLSHAFLPGMLERGRGTILNVASTAAFQPGPYIAVYAATKAFVLSFSEALWAEVRGRGVRVVALCPGTVETGFIEGLGDDSIRETAVFAVTMHAGQVATAALKALRGNGPTHIVGLRNWLLAQSTRLSPRGLVARIGAVMLRSPRVRREAAARP